MADNPLNRIEDLDDKQLARLVLDVFHRISMHHGLWFTEVRHQMGLEKAHAALQTVLEKSLPIQLQRLAKILGFQMHGDLPAPLLALGREGLLKLLDGVAANWLANDGVWFQAVEFESGMIDAKRCNDSCWAQFAPLEAWSIRRLLELPEYPGLAGLKQALNFRLYARINSQTFIEEAPNQLVFQMNECRVQSARKRKNLDDYPCKSGGTVEYTYFARTIDPRIRTECIGCPPDQHPQDWYCAWRFRVESE